MNPQIHFSDADGIAFTVEVDYNMKGYALHQFSKMTLTPEAAKELASELVRLAAWSEHPLYQWAVKKTSQP